MRAVEIAPGVHWVGSMDPDLRVFDVIMRAEHGTTYNAYLVKGERATALIETVKATRTREYLDKLSTLVELESVDYVVVNHTEPDHSGSLGALLEAAPSARLVSSRNAVPFIRAILNRPVEVKTVEDGEELELGGKTLRFLHAPFLHWPDTMFTYLVQDRILFPCDFLGCHYADERLFDDRMEEFSHAFSYYFDVIIRPFKEHALKALDKLEGLPIDLLAPSHGPLRRRDVASCLESYRRWCTPHPAGKRPRLLVLYASSYGNTRRMAEELAQGAREGGAEPGLFDLQVADPVALLDEVERARGLAVGSLTINGDAVKPVWDFLSSLATIKLRGKVGATFGSYGWSGEASRLIEDRLRGLRLKLPLEAVRAQLVPTEEDLQSCRELGRSLAAALDSGS